MRHEPRAGGARARASTAADATSLTQIRPERQREPFAVNIIAGLWRGVDVVISPPNSQYPLRHFRDHSEALTFAEQLATLQGWPLFDRTGDAS